ncbi:hypothetical protein A3Q56_03821 [Intoshia linei]|uniref:Frizzled-4 n=1 Tax=Intoshia linei TaxID=1819745 RepID=A0A177B2F7_9BILA|nr:hypothetical protein A3Q56_03821 [Intoshia linei]
MKLIYAILLIYTRYTLQRGDTKCIPLTVKFCRGMGYNYTISDSMYGTQTQIETIVEGYKSYNSENCSKYLDYLICLLYVPACQNDDFPEGPTVMRPCRNFCLRVKDSCKGVINKLKIVMKLPPILDCYSSSFPTREEQQFCATPFDKDLPLINTNIPIEKLEPITTIHPVHVTTPKLRHSPKTKNCSCKCHYPYINIKNKCFISCDKLYGMESNLDIYDSFNGSPVVAGTISHIQTSFLHREISLLKWWNWLCLISAFLCTTLALITHFIKPNRFQYPERAIIQMSFWYLVIIIISMISLFIGSENQMCSSETSINIHNVLTTNSYRVITDTLPFISTCKILFIIVYFCRSCAYGWCICLSICWFLMTALNWERESIGKISVILHTLVYLVSSIITIVCATIASISADPLMTRCWIGLNRKMDSILFDIVPTSITLSLSLVLFVIGFCCAFRTKNHNDQTMNTFQNNSRKSIFSLVNSQASKIENLILKMAVFSVIVLISLFVLLFEQIQKLLNIYNFEFFYTIHNKNNYNEEKNIMNSICSEKCGSFNSVKTHINMLEIILNLIPAIAVIIIICGKKSISIWKEKIRGQSHDAYSTKNIGFSHHTENGSLKSLSIVAEKKENYYNTTNPCVI